jgi:hypothetical protein
MDTQVLRVVNLISQWIIYRGNISEPGRYMQLAQDLYLVRNDKLIDSLNSTPYPSYLIDSDNEIMAAIEHYFLCRGWVGNGVYNAVQVLAQAAAYDAAKELGAAPQHNPSKPVSPPSLMQQKFQGMGIADGKNDLKKSGKPSPDFNKPPKYW